MDLLKIVSRRSFLSEIVYMALNVALAIGLLLIIRSTGSLLPAFGLVLLSKWRVLAVRPRYWFANIQANLVDFIVSISMVVFLFTVSQADVGDGQKLAVQVILVALYIGWLLFLKPKSKRIYIVAQSGIALFVGVSAIFMSSYSWIATPVVLLMWLVGYATARHILSNYDEGHTLLVSLVWGLALAEIGWLAYHWTVAYPLPIVNELMLPQISIIVLCFGFLAYKSYDSYVRNDKIQVNDIILPLLFTISMCLVLLIVLPLMRCGSISCVLF
ncbi:MAG TPA: hypothetical protein VFS65_01440 [Candidatus Saccharimonadales bacterium]|nr:hypothetical protein [Candidatus Saccharimonadales bacterium]